MTNSTEPSKDIFEAVVNDDMDALKNFVEVEKVPVNSTTNGKRTAAYVAAKKGRLEMLKYLVNTDADLIKSADMYGITPLIVAIEEGFLEIVKYLIEECKVSVSQHNKRLHGNTLLHIAARAGQLEVLKYIVNCTKKKIEVNAKNELGEPPCFVAAEEGHLDIIKFLAEETKADFSLVDSKKDNILFVSTAAGNANVEIPKYLLDERKIKFDINKKDGLGRSIVYLAASVGNLEFLKYFVGEKSADVNSGDRLGRTPLHQAAMINDIQIAKYLLEKGADPTIQDHNGRSPRESTGDLMMMKYLEKMEKSHRTRRNVVVLETVTTSQMEMSRIQNLTNDGLQESIASDQMLWFDISKIGQRGWSLSDRINSSGADSFLLLFFTWINSIKCIKRSGFKRARAEYRSSPSPHEMLEDRMDAFDFSAIEAEPGST